MFSGIIESIGKINAIERTKHCVHFTIIPNRFFDDIAVGDSLSVNGVCLTITTACYHDNAFQVTAVPETLRVTNLDKLTEHSEVNLERSLPVTGRIGGHYIQGHVDSVGKILEISKDGESALLIKIKMPLVFSKYIVNKGYIGLDGMSITVIEATPEWFTVTFIPHTQQMTIVKHYEKGALINIEVDIIAKYIEKLIGAR